MIDRLAGCLAAVFQRFCFFILSSCHPVLAGRVSCRPSLALGGQGKRLCRVPRPQPRACRQMCPDSALPGRGVFRAGGFSLDPRAAPLFIGKAKLKVRLITAGQEVAKLRKQKRMEQRFFFLRKNERFIFFTASSL